MLKAFPKIFQLGTRYTEGIFDGLVEVSEKIDGSQVVFGKINGELHMRSKGAVIYLDHPDKMFVEAVEYVKSIEDRLPDGFVFYAEYLKKPKHNVLFYDRVPKNHLMLFGVIDSAGGLFNEIERDICAEKLEIEAVPVLCADIYGMANRLTAKEFNIMLDHVLNRESVLGGAKIEGVVMKNYAKEVMIGGQVLPVMCAKYVSESFKEVHRRNWKKENTGKGKWDTYKESFCTEARWQKAIQHLREKGEIEDSPTDIGKILKEIQADITEEEKENIKEYLWSQFGKEVLRCATRGLPEWYKRSLLVNCISHV